jgi:Protein of unknown function (DUF2846)
MNNLVAIVLLAWSVSTSQDQATVSREPAGCGPAKVQFDVKTDGAHHPTAPPDPDKAVVYVVENQRAGCFMCSTTIKVGLDGGWVAATKGNSYTFFSVAPGDHHLCATFQAYSSSADTTAVAGFNAEAGKVYYFRARLTDRNNSGQGGVLWALDLDPINGEEGQFLTASYAYSTSHQRKQTQSQ